jgi:TolB-like protein/DNA-binding winged helix-turn-helix (wHTH) protein/cytochrome c-type biogenesis protein CcmH/NrfG
MTGTDDTVLRFGDFVLDLTRRSVLRGGQPVELRPKSFDVLALLARNAGRVVTKDELMAGVWPGVVVSDESLTRCVSDIRQALGDDAQRLIKTVPRRGYAFAAPTAAGDTAPVAASTRGWWPWALAALVLVSGAAGWWAAAMRTEAVGAPSLSIVVLPLASRDSQAQQRYLAEALTEAITIDLSRIPGSFVIARSTADSYRARPADARVIGRELGVRYVLEGGLDRFGEEVRLSLQLVDAQSGRALWAERFDGPLRDIAELRRRVTDTVAQSLHLRLVEAESERSRRRPAADLAAQDLVLQAWSLLRRYTPSDVAAARALLEQAVARDAGSALAWALLAETYTADVGSRWLHLRDASRADWLSRGERAADRAYALDPNLPKGLAARGYVLALQGRAEAALAIVERHLALDRNDASAWFRLCYTNATLGRPSAAIEACQEAIRLSPRDDQLCGFYVVLAAAHLHLGQDEQALGWARKSALERPTFSVAHSWIASAAAQLGDLQTAHAAVAEFRRLKPDYTVTSFRDEKLCANALCESQRERYYDGLRKAGLPE